jgi:molecular chaperone GrpE
LFKANLQRSRSSVMTKKKPERAQTAREREAAETASREAAAEADAAVSGLAGVDAAPMEPLSEATEPGHGAAASLVEAAGEATKRLEQEAAEWKDRCLRAAAELENFKRRAIKERSETWSRAQADVIGRTLDVVDDLGRVAALDPAQTTAQALHEGMGLVERKLIKALESVGVERMDPMGQPFDPNVHEAVMTLAAPSPEADHTVGSVLQLGYRLNGMLLRPARVAVFAWTEPAAPGAAGTAP